MLDFETCSLQLEMAVYKSVHFFCRNLLTRNEFTLHWKPYLCPRQIFQKYSYASVARQKLYYASRLRVISPSLLRLSKTNSFTTSCCKSPANVAAKTVPKYSQQQSFHTTPPQKAIPPALWLLLRPFANFAAILFGRYFRKIWQRLPQAKRDKIILRIKRNKQKLIGVMGLMSLGLLLYVLAHIEEVPYTKRRRFLLFSHEDMRNLCSEVENEVLSMYQTIDPRHPLFHRIENVMVKLMEANRKEILESGVSSWKIYVIEEPEINNAMVLPNGTVFIFSGIMETCFSDDQLGTVLAHEIAHVLLNHQGESLSKEHFVSLLSVLLITAMWAVLPDIAAFLSHMFASKTSALLIHLPFSRLMESEADAVGLNLAAKACLDVREASVFWAKMALREELGCEEKPLELLSSHPSHETRQKAIDELIPDALKLREACKCGRLSSLDPRAKFTSHSRLLREAKLKDCLSCKSIFSRYDL